jgi:serine carboxypeptidase-like clade 1
MTNYLNRADVRAAFNIPAFVQGYQPCNNPMYGTYQAFREGSIWIYNILKGYPDRYRLMHYSGDTDGAVATLGTKRWMQAQGWSVTNEWRPWTTNGDISGYIEDYGTYTFATIHGVGHMAPQWKRQNVEQLIMKFVHNETIN